MTQQPHDEDRGEPFPEIIQQWLFFYLEQNIKKIVHAVLYGKSTLPRIYINVAIRILCMCIVLSSAQSTSHMHILLSSLQQPWKADQCNYSCIANVRGQRLRQRG